MIDVACASCGKVKQIYPSQRKARDTFFCNKSCHRTHTNKVANPSWTRDLSGENNPMYGKHPIAWNKNVRGELSHNWKGGIHRRKDGYVRININGERKLLHRHLFADKLKGENIVHHKDGDPSNNARENLEILPSQSEHATLHNLKRWHG